MGAKLTKAELKALEWFGRLKAPVSQFRIGDPPLSMIKRLRDRSLVQQAGSEPGLFGFVRYEISSAGIAALQDEEAQP